MKILLKLTYANIRMHFRDRGAVIWTLLFPMIVILIFGVLDFSKFGGATIGLVYDETTKQYAEAVENTLAELGDSYEITKGNLEDEKQALQDDNRTIVVEFKQNQEDNKVDINAYLNKSEEQGAQVIFLILQKILSDFELKIHQLEPLFSVNSETVNVFNLRNIDLLIPGVIAMALMQGGLFGVAGTIVTYRQQGILRRLFATPLSKSNFLLSQILSRLVISITQVIILLLSSYLVFQIQIIGNLILVTAIATLGSLVFLSLGFVISGIAKTTETARAMIMPIQMILMFTGGVYFEREVLPSWLFNATAYAPLTYLSDSLRSVMTKGDSLAESDVKIAVIGLCIWLFLFAVLAIKTFKWEKDR